MHGAGSRVPRSTLTRQQPLQSAPQAQPTDVSSVLVRLQRLLRPARLRSFYWHSRLPAATQLTGGHSVAGSRSFSAFSQAARAAGVDEPVQQLQQATTTPPQEPTAEAAYLAPLSEEQRAAVTAPVDKHVRVVAGPGSGKTRVLTARAAHLMLAGGAQPWQLMCITFTNKAADEIKERLDRQLGPAATAQITAGTFHSVAARALRSHIKWLGGCGRTGDFTIHDQEDGVALLAGWVAEQRKTAAARNGDANMKPDMKEVRAAAKELQRRISLLKNSLPCAYGFSAQELVDAVMALGTVTGLKQLESSPARDETVQALQWYEEQLRASNVVDFDDLLSLMVALLRDGEVAAHFQRRYRWLLVDEFQDTNAAQYELVRLLGMPQGHVFVVGDPDQAIYRWRGADSAKMSHSFLDDFPGAQCYSLCDNYRSTPQVLAAALAVLPTPAPLQPLRGAGAPVQVVETGNGYAEADWLAGQLRQMERQGDDLREVAVLFRVHLLSRVIEQALVRAGVPYVLLGGTPFWGRTEVKDVVAYLRLAANLDDVAALRRVINVPPRKLGAASLAGLDAWAAGRGQTLAAAVFDGCQDWSPEDGDLPPLPPAKEMGVSSAAHRALRAFRHLVCDARAFARSAPLTDTLWHLLRKVEYKEHVMAGRCNTGSKAALTQGGNMSEEEGRWANVMQVITAASEFASKPRALPMDLDEPGLLSQDMPSSGLAGMAEFVQEAALLSGDESAMDAPGVRLLTLHAAKGLEFDTVFIAGLEEGILPGSRAVHDEAAMAEEQRLAYVGLTRARKQLTLMHTRRRALWGPRSGAQVSARSRFLTGLVPNVQRDEDDEETYIHEVSDISPAASGSATGTQQQQQQQQQQQWHQRRRVTTSASGNGSGCTGARGSGLMLSTWQEQLARRQARAAAEQAAAAAELAAAAGSSASSNAHEADASSRSPPSVQAARRDDLPQSQTSASRQQAAQPDRAKRWQSTAATPPDWQGASLGHRGDVTQRPQQAAPRSPLAQQQRSATSSTSSDASSRDSASRHGRGGGRQPKAQQAPPNVVRSGRRSRADRQNSRGSSR